MNECIPQVWQRMEGYEETFELHEFLMESEEVQRNLEDRAYMKKLLKKKEQRIDSLFEFMYNMNKFLTKTS